MIFLSLVAWYLVAMLIAYLCAYFRVRESRPEEVIVASLLWPVSIPLIVLAWVVTFSAGVLYVGVEGGYDLGEKLWSLRTGKTSRRQAERLSAMARAFDKFADEMGETMLKYVHFMQMMGKDD